MSGRKTAPERPDWRWARAVVLSEQSAMAASGRLPYEDHTVQTAVAYKRQFNRGMGQDDHPLIWAAHRLFLHDPHQRMFLEAHLLAGSNNEQIADCLWCDPEVVQVYHDLFFDVRPGLTRPAWICATVFRGMPHHGQHRGDQHGLLLRLAWLGGRDILKLYTERSTFQPGQAKLMRQFMRENLLKIGVDLSFNAGLDKDSATFVVAMLNEDASGADGNKNEITDHIAQMISEAGALIGLAAPAATRNLVPSAREPRVYEQLGEPEPATR